MTMFVVRTIDVLTYGLEVTLFPSAPFYPVTYQSQISAIACYHLKQESREYTKGSTLLAH